MNRISSKQQEFINQYYLWYIVVLRRIEQEEG